MPGLSVLSRRVKEFFGSDAFHWVDRSYSIDWVVSTAFWVIAGFISSWPVYERSFSIEDSLISHPHTRQQISGTVNGMVALYVPFAVSAITGLLSRSMAETHHGILAVWSGRGLAHLITEFLKNRVGRLRPDFLSRCQWESALQACTGKESDIIDGRRSFPSGHSSTAFAGMTFLSFFLAGKTAAWCLNAHLPAGSLKSSRLARLFVTFSPLLWASWVALSRVEDYRHHKEDVIAGSLIGIFSSTTCYLIFFPNPFSIKNYAKGLAGRPRVLYRDDMMHDRSRNDGFELTRLEDEIETV